MNRLLKNIKQDIIRVLGKIFTVPTEPTQRELIELEREVFRAQMDHKLMVVQLQLEARELAEAFAKIQYDTVALSNAFRGIGMSLTSLCKCQHGSGHHNPDKRTKTGYGRCICGGCRKYSPMALVINSAKLTNINLLKPISITNNGGTVSITFEYEV